LEATAGRLALKSNGEPEFLCDRLRDGRENCQSSIRRGSNPTKIDGVFVSDGVKKGMCESQYVREENIRSVVDLYVFRGRILGRE
jgi:hypothetical protein